MHIILQVDGARVTTARIPLPFPLDRSALASYQVGERAIEEFRATGGDDARLTGALAWASFSAARKIGTRLGLQVHEHLTNGSASQHSRRLQ